MIRIGTRKSPLAIWQANYVKAKFKELGFSSTLIPIESSGDKDLVQPVYKMGIKGVFTKALDQALLSDSIDVAVHSLKDVPTILPEGVEISAYLKRGSAHDVMVYHKNFIDWKKNTTIGTGSLRRQAQWLRKYPNHISENLRGNLQRRLEMLNSSDWGGAIFAKAGLERINLLKNKFTVLDWMIPAPSQGIIGVASLEKNKTLNEIVKALNCHETQLCAEIERDFLNKLECGCTAPVGAYAFVENNSIIFHCGLFSLEGSEAIYHKTSVSKKESGGLGEKGAVQILNNGGYELANRIKSEMG